MNSIERGLFRGLHDTQFKMAVLSQLSRKLVLYMFLLVLFGYFYYWRNDRDLGRSVVDLNEGLIQMKVEIKSRPSTRLMGNGKTSKQNGLPIRNKVL